jgi:hypothetical protein
MQVFGYLVVVLALMESGCLAVSFCIEIYASGVVLVMVLISSSPVVGVLIFFNPGASAVFLREEGILNMLSFAGFFLWC